MTSINYISLKGNNYCGAEQNAKPLPEVSKKNIVYDDTKMRRENSQAAFFSTNVLYLLKLYFTTCSTF